MWNKPDSEQLLPEYMQEAMDFVKASAVFFGIPGLATCLLMHYKNLPYSFFPNHYAFVLNVVSTTLNLFYLMHLVPALIVRYAILQTRMRVRGALFVAAAIDFLAILIVYPASSLLNPETLRRIYLYAAIYPLLMTFFTLRIGRLRFGGGVVIVAFIGLLCYGFV